MNYTSEIDVKCRWCWCSNAFTGSPHSNIVHPFTATTFNLFALHCDRGNANIRSFVCTNNKFKCHKWAFISNAETKTGETGKEVGDEERERADETGEHIQKKKETEKQNIWP